VLGETQLAQAQARLIGEAKIMATVGHPNVAAVYDAGSFGTGDEQRVFIAMELVTGQNLRAWLATRPGLAAVLPILQQGGHGLAAAHAAGVVHGDFKPENVLLGEDGRVRVVDFGLARPFGESVASAGAPQGVEGPLRTVTGGLVGTPAYMAPEQLRGGAADARADQFAFAIVLWEALTGERPFAGDTVAELADAVNAGRRRRLTTPLPPPLRRAIERALSTRPEDRFASMEELLTALTPRRPRTRIWVSAAAVTAALVGFGGWLNLRPSDPPSCARAAAVIDEAWNAAHRQTLAARLAATGVPYAAATTLTTTRLLDRYAQAWKRGSLDACEATTVRHQQSADMLDRRTACLRERLRAFTSVLAVLEASDAQQIARATTIADSLPQLTDCADTETLAALVPPPADPAARAVIEQWRAKLSEVRASHIAGKMDDAFTLATEVAAKGKEVAYPPLEASAKIWLAEVLSAQGKSEAAWAEARTAFDLALAGSDRRAALWAASILAMSGATDPRQRDEALRWVGTARSLLVHSPDPIFAAKIENAEGNAYLTAGDDQHARPAFERAIALFRGVDPDHANLGSSIAMIGIIDLDEGKLAAALERLRDALARIERTLGASHPEVASALVNLAMAESANGQYTVAERGIRRALALQQQTYGPDYAYSVYSYLNLGQVLVQRGEFTAAVAAYGEAERIAKVTFGAEHPLTAQVIMAQGEVAARRGDGAAGIELSQRALAILEPALGKRHATVATAEATLALAYRTAGKPTEALEHARISVDEVGGAASEAEPHTALARRELGEALLANGQAAAAVAALTPAERALVNHPLDPLLLAEVRFALTRALLAAGPSNRPAAAELARRALAEFPTEGNPALRQRLERAAAVAK
jgi:eukaryotic-like serine/threonine-protein kinase